MARTEVLVVGAGPTGLVMALWLDAQGVKVRIIDKSTGPGTTSRATAVHARTLELYRQTGIADAVVAAGHRSSGINMWTGGKRRAHVPFNDFGDTVTPYPFLLIYPQDLHEAFLVERLRERNIEVERQTELVDFTDNGTGVTARLRGPDGHEDTCEAAYLTGCDGARSTVRTVLGASFEGGTYEQRFYVADVEVESDPFDGETSIVFDGPEFMLVMPYGRPGVLRFVGTVRGDRAEASEPLTFDDVGHRSVAALGLTVRTVNWFSTYRVHHRVTERFRHGRAFLLGDAAHVHSPAGGQGMNTGIGDAINLAWKLAAVLKGRAGDDLIDSFEAERPVFARKLVETTDRAFTFVTATGNVAEFIRTRIAPLFVKAAWSVDAVRESMFRVVSQTMIDYPGSPLSAGKAGKVSGGERLPYVRFDGGDNYGPMSGIGWQVHVYGAAQAGLRDWCEAHAVPLHVFDWHAEHGAAGLARDASYLLRPDTYVALADPQGSPANLDRYLGERNIRLAR
ncbi:FAD-dependent monooxygenase [Lichenihabitans sp. Uapishka_5]|uniref:FAD-dependent monooxygenase n=1 Tax=Lichenihabitans sp. Uapishka_5 TaxID=3037302 RepID=UPI0029E810EE|nr:FAD-dependent monooxygenase [Lichenihabitans sp. Uapishka_5]MDX7953713.1 FAD-dependent monooxygenase [Lichenihabitans sp. Uapishka_5]